MFPNHLLFTFWTLPQAYLMQVFK